MGLKALKVTLDATTQGVGCYVKTLLANVLNNGVLLNLNLGSVVTLSSISWEKLTNNNQCVSFGNNSIISSLDYQFTDQNPRKGIQYYRAKLITMDNKIIYSNPASANFYRQTSLCYTQTR